MNLLPLILLSLLVACTPLSTQLREDGFNRQWRAFDSIQGEAFETVEVDLQIRVVVVPDIARIQQESELPGVCGAYFQYKKMMMIPGKMVKGKIIVPGAVLGHEVEHALQRQDPQGRFVDPDLMRRYEE